jgi:spermidine synthase
LTVARSLPRPAARSRIVHRAHGRFGAVFVVDEGGRRYLRFGSPDGTDQSVFDPRTPERLTSAYLHAVVVGALLAEPLESALLLGLGGGGFVRFARRYFPHLAIDAVEIDPVVVRLARRYFAVRTDRRRKIHVDDAAGHLGAALAAGRRYDLVILDAYFGSQIPTELKRRKFFTQIRDALTPRGIAIVNVGLPEKRAEDVTLARIASVFRGHCFELRNEEDDNRVAVAARVPLPGKRELVARIRAIDTTGDLPLALAGIAASRRPCPGLRRRAARVSSAA